MPIERYELIDYTSLTVGAAAVGFADASPAMDPARPADLFVGVVEGASIRTREDGTDPTATEGMAVAVGSGVEVDGASVAAFKAIAQSGSGTLRGHFYRYVG